MSERGLIEDYIAELSRQLPFGRLQRRRIQAEVATHLHELTENYIAAGLEPQDAERLAIEQFGPAHTIARQFAEELVKTRKLGTRRPSVMHMPRVMVAATAFVVLAASGSAVAWAQTQRTGEDAPVNLTASEADRAQASARLLAHRPGVSAIEREQEGAAAYEVELATPQGEAKVALDSRFKPVAAEREDGEVAATRADVTRAQMLARFLTNRPDVRKVEREQENAAAYEVELVTAQGEVEITLDRDFNVVGSETE